MKIVIAGSGDLGFYLAKLLSHEAQDIVLIDQQLNLLTYAENHIDVLTIHGDCTSIEVLKNAHADEADIFIASTDSENVNIVSSILAKNLGAKQTIARINKSEYLSDSALTDFSKIGVDSLISTKHLAAEEIKILLEEASAMNFHEFEGGKLALVGFTIQESSELIDLSIVDTAKFNPNMSFRPIAILRKDETIIPRGNTLLKENDHVYFITKPDTIDTIIKITGNKKIKVRSILIIGGSSTALFTAKLLENDFKLKIIERDRERCEDLADQLNNTMIIHGDGNDSELLLDEGMEESDAVLALTGNSSTNIVSCLIAKNHGVDRTIALVEEPELIHLSQDIGIDTLINRKLIAASNIFRFIRKGMVKEVTGLLGVDAEIIEYEVSASSEITKTTIKDLNFPKAAIIGGVIRDSESFIPKGDFQINVGDKVVVFLRPSVIQQVESYFN
ncbi:MAG: Trk system potassium transporter TrkA [Flavobacteriales bacterium]|nr:Trk system potassium transporter TrkA [Flavobacteriales bacterium]